MGVPPHPATIEGPRAPMIGHPLSQRPMSPLRGESGEQDPSGERRGAGRYPALDNVSQVGWRDGEQLRTTSAQLMDVSREGVLIMVDHEPPRDVVVVFRLLEPTRTAWVSARVAQSRRMRQGPYQLRLAFIDPPPAGFLALAAARRGELN